MKLFPTVFDGDLGTTGEIHLEVNDTVTPVKLPLRRVPIASQDSLEEELTHLVSLGVIEKVTEPTDWVSSLVIATKANGKIRFCIDPQALNGDLKRCYYPLHVLADVLPNLTGARVFTICDVKNGF